MEKFFLKPANSGTVIDPETDLPLPSEGASVPKTAYWMGHVMRGDVTIIEKKAASAPLVAGATTSVLPPEAMKTGV